MNEPVVSERFDLDDIRAVREYNALRHAGMTSAEIAADTREGAAALIEAIRNRPAKKKVSFLASERDSVSDASAS